MSLAPGTRLGAYEVLAKIGEGGMGAVYRARDTKLDRDVAIKVLPDSLSGDPERIARFEREARALAALNHPHIAHIYGLEEGRAGQPGTLTRFIVMELVEGETLAQRLKAGPLPVEDALSIARQMTEALEAAHEKGITHRDLKPANIAFTAANQAKVLDFGLAKFAPGPVSSDHIADVANSPTITSPALMTGAGVILGTAAYMAPEQARGRVADKRSDVWAFGCVLFEMLTGARAFGGEDVADTLAAVVKGEAPFDLLPPDVSAPVREVLKACLIKDPRRRVGDMAAVRFVLDHEPALVARAGAAQAGLWMRYRGAAMAGVALLAVGLASLAWFGSAPAVGLPAWLTEAPQLSIDLPDKQTLSIVPSPFAISPDGRQLAFVAGGPDGKRNLWLRAMGAADAHLIPGTEGGGSPFWSPDSQSIGFFVGGTLKRVAVTGGAARTIIDNVYSGGTWNADDVIVVSRGTGSGDQLLQVPASGGTPKTLTTIDRAHQEAAHLWPQFLSDGRHFVFQVLGLDAGVYVSSLDNPADRKRLIAMGAADQVSQLGVSSGHLFFVRDGVLMTQAIDEHALTLTGDAIRLADNVPAVGSGRAAFSVSQNGVLVYRTGGMEALTQATWRDRDGKTLGTLGGPGAYAAPSALSPDGTTVAAVRLDAKGLPGLWLMDALRGTQTKFPVPQGFVQQPVWSPDGQRIAFSSGNPPHVYVKRSNGLGAEEEVLPLGVQTDAKSWSPDGTLLVYQQAVSATNADLWMVTMQGGQKRTPLLQSDANEANGRISPDGKWLAYQSNESGRNEVYVMSFPQPGRKVQVSASGGANPRWNRKGGELFFQSLDQKLMAAPVTTTPALAVGTPRSLFDAAGTAYDVAPDGRFLAWMPATDVNPPPLTVVLNWPALTKAR